MQTTALPDGAALVLIEWEDSHSSSGWQSLEGGVEDRSLLCRSVGWLVLDGAQAKVVVPHLNQQEPGIPPQGSGIMTIPASAVRRLVRLYEAA